METALNFLFTRARNAKPHNILTEGYRRKDPRHSGGGHGEFNSIIVNETLNSHVNTVKSGTWLKLAKIIRETAMFDLLTNTNIFMPVGNNCYYQLTGECPLWCTYCGSS